MGIDNDVANIIQAQLLFLESTDSSADIQIYINSPGGMVYAGLGIYDTMQLVGPDVATICTGMAASMAAVLLTAGAHGKRSVLPHSRVLIHQPMGAAVLLTAGAHGKRSVLPHSRVLIHQPMGGAEGQASDIEIAAAEIRKLKSELYDIIAKHSGQSLEKIAKDADRDYWMTASEAVAYGMVDNILQKNNGGR